MSLFDAFSTRDSSVKTNTTVTQDSYNISQNDTRVFDNLGNVNLTLGQSTTPDYAKLLPVVAVGAVAIGVGLLFLKRR
jgi:hypothetical protein